MAVTVEQFVQQIVAAGLMPNADLQAALSFGNNDGPFNDSEQLARLLVSERKLTAYQAQQICVGRGTSLILGNYLILDKLGQGGMGMVLKAQHRRMKRIVALKVVSPRVTKNAHKLRRFQREVEAAARLDHLNIVTAYDADEANGIHFLVMQYVEGADLSVLVKKRGPLPEHQALSCIIQTARGLQYAHNLGVIHRDIKPANLLLDRSGTVKILDMGLARLDSSDSNQDELTGTGQIMGTIDYMAPEQALDSKNADARADVYSLGVTLWYLLTGRPLFEGDTSVMKLLAHQNQAVPSLSSACPNVSAELEAVFSKMVAKSVEDRYQNMSEVIAGLELCHSDSDSTPSVAAAPGEDSLLEEFLKGIRSAEASVVADASSAKKKAKLPATELTVALRSPESNTDPQYSQSREQTLATRGSRRGGMTIPWWRRLTTGIALGSGSLILLLAAIVFFERPEVGLIRVEIDDPKIEVTVKGTDVVLKKSDQGTDVKLVPGDHTLIVHRGDFTFETDKLVLKSGERLAVKVEFVAGQVQVHQGDVLLGQGMPPEQLKQQDVKSQIVLGWQGWPNDAPEPAIAPFDALQSRAHQHAWAAYLNLPVYFTNSLDMQFVLIPPGEFMMGSTEAEIQDALIHVVGSDNNPGWRPNIESEGPQHRVTLTKPFYLAVTQVTQRQYTQITGTNPSHFSAMGTGAAIMIGRDTSNHPVETVNWYDAAEFCAQLSRQEGLRPFNQQSEGMPESPHGNGYRLPTEAEWEYACRAGTTRNYWCGDTYEDLKRSNWTIENSLNQTHPVGGFPANPFGLFDVQGNVWEWVQDWWAPKYVPNKDNLVSIDPRGATIETSIRVARGGFWNSSAYYCRATTRVSEVPTARNDRIGFRVALTTEGVKSALAAQANSENSVSAPWPKDAPPPAKAPFSVGQAVIHQQNWAEYLGVPVNYTNRIGTEFVLIPPGEFTMGSGRAEVDLAMKNAVGTLWWEQTVQSEMPVHTVILTQPFYLGRYEVTQAEYQRVTGYNPSHFSETGPGKELVAGGDTNAHPVEMVSWYDATDFCSRLSLHEKLTPAYERLSETVTRLDGNGYRLPTEAEWEFSCRAGTTSIFPEDDSDKDLIQHGWYVANSGGRTHAVGELAANAFGLHDMLGNVWEFVQDSWEPAYTCRFPELIAVDPQGPASGISRCVFRGGNWFHGATFARSASRHCNARKVSEDKIGFRLALTIDAVKQAMAERSAATPNASKASWQGWPHDAPEPATAPFISEQASKHQQVWAAYLDLPIEFSNSIDMKFILIPPGEFQMGAIPEEYSAAIALARRLWGDNSFPQQTCESEFPKHRVTLTKPIYVGVTEVTQSQYQMVMGQNPSHFSANGGGRDSVAGSDTSNFPVETVSWFDALEFCERLSRSEKRQPFYARKGNSVTLIQGNGYRLPTEAEWEFSGRAGTTTRYWTGDDSRGLLQTAWCFHNSEGKLHAAGQRLPNPFGLHDIHGSVFEWTQDWWDPTYYNQFSAELATDPIGPAVDGLRRVVRGGFWGDDETFCRVTVRGSDFPTEKNNRIGFRIVLEIDNARPR